MGGGNRYGGGRGAGKGLPSARFYGPQGGQQSYGRGKGGSKASRTPPPVSGGRTGPYPQGGKGAKGLRKPPGPGPVVPQSQPKRNDGPIQHTGNKFQTEYPFSQVVRKLVEHRLRTPHRAQVHGQLTKVIAHWVSIPSGEAQLLRTNSEITRKTKGEDSIKIQTKDTDADTEPETANSVDARVLLCGGVTPVDNTKKHILSRVSLYAAKQPTGGLQGYGGICTNGTDTEVIQQLVSKVKEQCGLDLSDVETWYKFVEMEYTAPLRNTVFYLPALWELNSELSLHSAATEEEVQVEETVEPEIPREGMTDDEYAEAKAAMKPIKNMITKINKTVVSTPITLSLSDCLNAEVRKHMPRQTLEFYTAADSLDEFLKKEMCTSLVSTLKDKRTEKQERENKLKEQEAARLEAKRKREEQVAAKKKVKDDEIAALREKWETENQGLTDDEKKGSKEKLELAEREILNRKDDDDEDANQTEVAPSTPGADKESEEAPKKKKFRTVVDVDQKKYEAFEFFDRGSRPDIRTGTLPFLRLQNILLCSDEDFSLDDVSSLMTAVGHSPHSLDYKSLVSTKREEEIIEPPTPEPEPEPEQAAMDEDKVEQEAGEEAPAEEAETGNNDVEIEETDQVEAE
eukprot:TRINITY_DN12079_c0_g1_i1.p1 TRINITY_DN12079_c0_g1~~TRINITY_DN12079_c0_g1_i1.p1  ORF type:complete len:628 (+),score=178.66 TRINITY_DN12079_c0_g1_i1:183-2066(+)